jgi:DNA repair protein RecN (Recombination protein N)
MLEELEVRNLGPIQQARLSPSSSMTAITGETGAGKSMLLNAIGLISGAPTNTARVSHNQDMSWVQAIFDVDEASTAMEVSRNAGLETEDGQLFLTRSVPVQGRSRSLVNGHTVPRSLLADLSRTLVTIHGQSDQVRIASPSKQRIFLDEFADASQELSDYQTVWQQLSELDQKLASLQEQQSHLIQQADYLRQSIDRIDKVDPQVGEDVSLRDRRDRIEQSAQIIQGVTGALAALDASQIDGDVDTLSVNSLLQQSIQSLQAIGIDSLFADTLDRLHSLETELSDIVFNITQLIDSDAEEADLDQINARIHELEELKNRWGPTLTDVLEWRKQAQFDLEDMDASPERIQELQNDREKLYQTAIDVAEILSSKRQQAAMALGQQVSEELASLAMSGAGLDVVVSQRPDRSLDSCGLDEVNFLFTPFPGASKLPMGSSASGGELSRLMLAMELVMAQSRRKRDSSDTTTDKMTFIFDEVDAGVGGKAAVELGKRLAQLAQDTQVIVVTHLPQVASWADKQFVVYKNVDQDGAETQIHEVHGDEREQEIARMLAGSESKTSLQHARELLASSSL